MTSFITLTTFPAKLLSGGRIHSGSWFVDASVMVVKAWKQVPWKWRYAAGTPLASQQTRKQRKENACVHTASSLPSFFIRFRTSIHDMGPLTFKSGLHSVISCEDVVKVTFKGVPHNYKTNMCTGMRLSFYRDQPFSI